MKVLLRDTQTGHYYAGPGRWVPERLQALEFNRIDLATRAYENEEYPFAEIMTETEGHDRELSVLRRGPLPAKRNA